ncbi:protein FAM216B [Lissotriton helveticus]
MEGAARNLEKIDRVRLPSSARNMSIFRGLRPGQKRYLYSTMQVYDAVPDREIMYDKYAHSLQRQNLLGYITYADAARYLSVLMRPEMDHATTKSIRDKRASRR